MTNLRVIVKYDPVHDYWAACSLEHWVATQSKKFEDLYYQFSLTLASSILLASEEGKDWKEINKPAPKKYQNMWQGGESLDFPEMIEHFEVYHGPSVEKPYSDEQRGIKLVWRQVESNG